MTMKKIVSRNVTVYSLYKNTKYEVYKPLLFYGWDISNDHRKILSLCSDVWPNEDGLVCFNRLAKMTDDGNAKIIRFSNKTNDLAFIALLHKERSKVAIVAAGGGYCCVCTSVESLPVAMKLYDLGYSVFMTNYSINKDCMFGACVDDIADGIKYLKKNEDLYNISLNDYIIGGFSAGGHCVGELLTDNFGFEKYQLPLPKCVFLGYPVITMNTLTHGGSSRNLLGENPSQELKDKFSIDKHIVNMGIKVFHWQCERDNTVPFENTILLRNALKKANVDFISESFDSDAHGWGIATGKLADGWIDRMIKFINK